jgi:two-component system, NtrC family, response regulator AtoC
MEIKKSPVIFVIDRNPIHSSLIKYHLNVNRFLNVQVFQTGEECIYRISKNVLPDFLISDYHIGDMNGFELIEKVREKSSLVRIFFFSAQDDPIFAVRLLEAGASDYILKTSKLDIGIAELIKNVKYLCREENPVQKIF